MHELKVIYGIFRVLAKKLESIDLGQGKEDHHMLTGCNGSTCCLLAQKKKAKRL